MTEPTTFEEFTSSLAERDLDGIDSEHTGSTLALVKSFNARG
ncbi:hypothetical protein [Acinetobacter seifertii]|nr:hypothetical protein [Acinetobacter seifertii]